MIEHYIREIQTVQVEGYYLLGGQCIGGNIAFEMAQELSKRGEQVLLVAMADSPNPLITAKRKNLVWSHWNSLGKQQQRKALISHGLSANLIENVLKVSEANWQVIMNHLPRMYSGRVVYLSAVENREQGFGEHFDPMQPNGWNDWVAGGIEVIEVPGMHTTYHKEPHIQVLAEKLNACLEEVDGVLLPE